MFNKLKKINNFRINKIIIRKLHDRKLPEIKYNKNKLPTKNKYTGINSPKKADYNKINLRKSKLLDLIQ